MPDHLGDPSGPHLPSEWLPDPSARMERALGAAFGALFGAPRDAAEDGPIEGIGVSAGVVEGPARVIDASSQFGRIRDGDILVTRATTAAFNVVLPLLRGIVTDRGGLLCHAAVVSREHSIPAVVGTVNATTRIADGARVRVDGGSGQVTVLS
jgi:pyruvate,water dikinase